MSMYGFRGGPVYRAGSPGQRLLDGLDQPLSVSDTMLSGASGQVLESFGLGTVIRDFITPRGNDAEAAANRREAVKFGGGDLSGVGIGINAYEAARGIFGAPTTGAPLDEESWKASPYFRESIPWDKAMTEDRAAALALQADQRAVREFYAQKRPIAAFLGGFAGAALDPINYIPIGGPVVKAAALAKFGRVGSSVLAGATDAALNTAVFGGLTAPERARYGDDVSFQALVSDVAMAAAIGGVFGLGEGVIGKVVADRKAKRELAIKAATDQLQTLRRVQEARVALNEAAVGLALDGEVRLSPNGRAAMEDIARAVIPDVVRQTEPRVPTVEPRAASEQAVAPVPAQVDDTTRGLTETSGGRQLPGQEPISGLEEALNNLRSGAGFAPVSMRKPIIDQLKRMGGVHPDSPLADELRALGVSNQSAPGLYRRDPSALQAADNIPITEVSDRFAGRGADDGAGYVTQQAWLDAVRDEMAGDPWLTPDEQRRLDEVRRPVEDLDEFLNRFGIDWRDRPNEAVLADIREVEQRLMAGFDDAVPASDRSMDDADLAHWGEQFADPDRPIELSRTYRVDPKAGTFVEQSEIDQLRAEGRLTAEDEQMLTDADITFRNAGAYGEALKAAATCLL